MNPVPLMKLCEIVVGLTTSDATTALVRAIAERMQKTVIVSKDMPRLPREPDAAPRS